MGRASFLQYVPHGCSALVFQSGVWTSVEVVCTFEHTRDWSWYGWFFVSPFMPDRYWYWVLYKTVIPVCDW